MHNNKVGKTVAELEKSLILAKNNRRAKEKQNRPHFQTPKRMEYAKGQTALFAPECCETALKATAANSSKKIHVSKTVI